ncbi:MAG: hypothetical protein IKK93_09915 [Campylobacter sp.]|nr:hypothetical protein [Campylobacter sp.]
MNKDTLNKIIKIANNTKALRILNHHTSDSFKALWKAKSEIIANYTNQLRIYYALKEVSDDLSYPLVINGDYKSQTTSRLFAPVSDIDIDEAEQFYKSIIKKKIIIKTKHRPTIDELKKIFWAEELADKNKSKIKLFNEKN